MIKAEAGNETKRRFVEFVEGNVGMRIRSRFFFISRSVENWKIFPRNTAESRKRRKERKKEKEKEKEKNGGAEWKINI